MQKVNLYRYEENGKVTITPNKRNETDAPSRMRLVADEGTILTNGTIEATVIDVSFDDIDKWQEINDLSELEQKSQAYDILMGVSE